MTKLDNKGYIRPYSREIDVVLRLLDAVIICGGLLAMHHLYATRRLDSYLLLGTLSALTFTVMSSLSNMYRSHRLEKRIQESLEIFKNWSLSFAMMLVLGFALKLTEHYSRLLVGTWFICTPGVMILCRLLIRGFAVRLRRNGYNSRSVAIIGDGPRTEETKKKILAMPSLGLKVKGLYSPSSETTAMHQGTLEDLVKKSKDGEIDLVYICLEVSNQNLIKTIIDSFSDTTSSLYLVPDRFTSHLLRNRWYNLGGTPILSIQANPFYGVNGVLKRCEDLVLACGVLCVASIPMLIIAAMIKSTSRGPILYKQRRYGIGGNEIYIWKFRTMTVCESDEEFSPTIKNDPRVTPIGRFLRRHSLDELPQFFNVLQGRMSVIGPRPHAVKQNEEYRRQIKGYMIRYQVKPGISGWAQVNGWRGETDNVDKMKRRVEYDLDYIDNWSLGLDLKIFFMSVFKGFSGQNAY
jgi:putative colanic acid biosynthesis UDP-glucose lipid carrier transferase